MKTNRNIAIISYCSLIVFVLLIGNLLVFLLKDNSAILSNTYNSKRQDLLEERVIRGNIISSDGKVLAKTIVDKKGNETREYPYDNMFAHAVGYMEKGKTGIEQEYNYYMLTSNTNPVLAAMNELEGKKNNGDNVVTTLNYNLQKTAYNALGNRRGAVIAMEPDTGKILAMVSRPDYNPNDISDDWEQLIKDKAQESRLLNRATQGLYPPGSTFKLVTLLEYIRENNDIDNFSYTCKGKESFTDSSIKCYKSKNHGKEDIKTAFAKSCNCAFANIGLQLNLNSLKTFTDTLMFNKDLDCRFEYKKSSFNLDASSKQGEVVQTVIGQGQTMITPLHNAMLASMIANGGNIVNPVLVDHIETAEGNRTVRTFKNEEPVSVLSQNEVRLADECMKETVKSGTAEALSGKKYIAAGKTGSAEYGKEGASHAWFIGYAEYNGKKIAVSIIVEGAGTGSDYAVPIAGKIFDAYY